MLTTYSLKPIAYRAVKFRWQNGITNSFSHALPLPTALLLYPMKKLCLFVFALTFSQFAFAASYPGTPLPRSTPEVQGISSASLLPLIEEAEQQQLGFA